MQGFGSVVCRKIFSSESFTTALPQMHYGKLYLCDLSASGVGDVDKYTYVPPLFFLLKEPYKTKTDQMKTVKMEDNIWRHRYLKSLSQLWSIHLRSVWNAKQM